MQFIVVFDACVLYPAPLRDFLLRLAISGLFSAKWTEQIHDEWMRNLSKSRPEIADKLPRTKNLMNKAVPDALVTGFEPIISGLELPDQDDRHVLAAAIQSGAQEIITFNLKDFPHKILKKYGIKAIHPDVFIENQLDLHQGTVIATAKQHRSSLKNPTKSAHDYLDTLSSQGLIITAKSLNDFIDLI